MSVKSKAWNWGIVTEEADDYWKKPSNDMYFLLNRWTEQGKKDFLDLGVGLGRHAIQFAKAGFNVTGFDLSETSIEETKKWAEKEKLDIKLEVGDMLKMPFANNSFDCVLAYHVVGHTDTDGMRQFASELSRILRKDGEFYLTIGTKQHREFLRGGEMVDENTVRRMEEGPEHGVPHFYADYDLIFDIFKDFKVMDVEEKQTFTIKYGYRNTDEHGLSPSGWHWYILGRKK